MGQSLIHTGAADKAVDEVTLLRHELTNVLSGLSGMVGLLKSTGLEPEQEGWLEAIEESAGQMHFLLGSTVLGGTQPGGCHAGRFNGIQFLEQIVTAQTPAAASKGLRLLLTTALDLPVHWNGDTRLLRQLLDNLLANALKFTDAGDVVVGARAADGQDLVLTVSDSGPGVPRRELAGIFQVRERGSNGRERPGQGLGLAICRQISACMGGTIECARNPAGGSVFTVTLPGALEFDGERIRTLSALECLRCVLALDPPLRRSTANFLERLGVEWGVSGNRSAIDPVRHLLVEITAIEPRPGEAWAGIQLRPAGSRAPGDTVRVRPPITQAAIERALLSQALAWRWTGINPGGTGG